ncbi:MAG: right-handed parallel beta-helix repeat-containing protein [Candidatus Heimdallarchaeota archaeon]|nr:hypothetical protein [Candidatus Heimdallarchaeota archaeon]MCG3257082.1 right-handed parallel beta-helix repeat-containing protein [Candidatus Heimdallarchaeota archaeon]MCK4612142.1 right-handed parallel beta-helix repeat-containing protein [Candidatus Heimdallarchaeota archaeon]
MVSSDAERAYQTPTLERRDTPNIDYESRLKQKEYTTSYISHPSIEILSDSDFGNYSSSGLGTIDEPFVIENYNITTSNKTAIIVENTTKYFIIRNCFLRANNQGIYLYNVSFGTGLLENNNCSMTNKGIWGTYAHGIKIVNNTCSENYWSGIYLEECIDVTIVGNLCEKNRWGGIVLQECPDSEVKNNIVIENDHSSGISLSKSLRTRVMNNTCINNGVAGIQCHESNYVIIEQNHVYNDNGWSGIAVDDSLYVSVLNNTITSDRKSLSFSRSYNACIKHNKLYSTGLDLYELDLLQYQFLDIQDNLVNGKKLGFYTNLNKIKIIEPNYGQLILVDCNDIVIANQRNEEGFIGITIYKCNSIEIKDSIITSLDGSVKTWGIRVYVSENIDIVNNVCSYGIGIYLENTKNVLIKSNLINNGSFYGIYLVNADYSRIINNICKFNIKSGMVVSLSENCEIIYNRIESNGFSEYQGFGLSIGGSNNILHHNIFLDNTFNGTIQAKDSGINNTWYEEKAQEGNFWSDYSGVGPYLIYGYSNSTDPYPLSKIPVYSDFNYKNFYYFFLILIPIFAYPIHKANKFLKEIRID